MQEILNVNNIAVFYGSIRAIKGISFTVNAGEVVTLIGANGAGKTTTLNTIAGLLHPKSGSVSFMGENLASVSPHSIVSRGLALVPEGRRIFLQMTVEENLEMGAYTQKKEAVKPLLEQVYEQFPRLKERRRQIGGTLSGGEQQMLTMARGLMMEPKLMLLDEPSMGLAPVIVEQIFEIIADLHRRGITILLVEQNAYMALQIAQRGYVIQTGSIALTDASERLQNNAIVRGLYLGEAG